MLFDYYFVLFIYKLFVPNFLFCMFAFYEMTIYSPKEQHLEIAITNIFILYLHLNFLFVNHNNNNCLHLSYKLFIRITTTSLTH